MIILDSLLTPEYFEDLDIAESHKYVVQHPFDIAQPNQSIPYDKKIKMSDFLLNLFQNLRSLS